MSNNQQAPRPKIVSFKAQTSVTVGNEDETFLTTTGSRAVTIETGALEGAPGLFVTRGRNRSFCPWANVASVQLEPAK